MVACLLNGHPPHSHAQTLRVAVGKVILEAVLWAPCLLSTVLAYTTCAKTLRDPVHTGNLSGKFLVSKVRDKLEADLLNVWIAGAGEA